MKLEKFIELYMKHEIAVYMMGEAFLYGVDYVEKHYKELSRGFYKWYNSLTDEQKEKRIQSFIKYFGAKDTDQEGT